MNDNELTIWSLLIKSIVILCIIGMLTITIKHCYYVCRGYERVTITGHSVPVWHKAVCLEEK